MTPDSMIFVDKSLDDNLINLIQTMLDCHIDRKYEELRHIIMGYDSKNKKWICRYGKALEKRLSGHSIDYTSSIYSFYMDTENFNKGMIFYEDEVYNNVRFHMDESVKRILYVLFNISNMVIDYRHIIDIIISDWNLKNMADSLTSITSNKVDIDPDVYGDLYFHQIEVRESAWKDFKRITKHKGVTIRDGFKYAVISFLEDRVSIINNLNRDNLNGNNYIDEAMK